MENMLIGTVIEMDISHMRAEIKLDNGELVDAKVGRIYDIGDEAQIYDVQNVRKPWYLQGEEYIDEDPISEAETFRSW